MTTWRAKWKALRRALRAGLAGRTEAAHPAGSFYSPIVDPAELAQREAELWPEGATECLGIDFDDASHREVLGEWFPRFHADFDYPAHGAADAALEHYYTGNSQFGWLDARALFVILRALAPRKILEVGSGYSSLLMADVNQRFLGGRVEVRCIEPYPRPFLARRVPGITEVLVERVERLPLATFASLAANDVLFIDSSHVAKTGSDVNFLFFEVLPRLAPGVLVHVHDVFLPAEYPRAWVLGENRSWNEQYLLRALLMYSTAFRPVFGSQYALLRHTELLRRALALPRGEVFGGGSFWMRRT